MSSLFTVFHGADFANRLPNIVGDVLMELVYLSKDIQYTLHLSVSLVLLKWNQTQICLKEYLFVSLK